MRCAQRRRSSTDPNRRPHIAVRDTTLIVMRTRPSTPSSGAAHRISGPDELVQAIPYLLGFRPARSLVLVGLHERALVVTARLDLDDAQLPGAVAHTIAAMVRGGTSTVVAAVWDDDHVGPVPGSPLPWSELVDPVRAEAERAGCELLDVVLVGRSRWWSLACASPGCCPPEGRELLTTPTPFAAAATYEGKVPLPDRRALEALLDPLADADRDRLEPLIAAAESAAVQAMIDGHHKRHERSVKRAIFAAARAADEPAAEPLTDADIARYGAALAATPTRDSVWLAVDDGRLDGRGLWRDLARRLPVPYDAPALFLYGWAAWRAGEGSLAGIATERALRSDPQYTAADLLLAAVSGGVNPRRFPALRRPA